MYLKGQTIDIENETTGEISHFSLCMVIGARRMETPNADAQYIADMRDYDVGKGSDRTTHETRAIVPNEHLDAVFDALRTGRLVLAEVENDFLRSIIAVPDFRRVDAKAYNSRYRRVE